MRSLFYTLFLAVGLFIFSGCQNTQANGRVSMSDGGTSGPVCRYCYMKTTRVQSLPNKGAPFQRDIETSREVCEDCVSAGAAIQ